MNQKLSPKELPGCNYPKASDFKNHGLYELPDSLTSIDWTEIKKYRSNMFSTVGVKQFSNLQILEMARMTAQSFAKNEPMKRHLQPPLLTPETILNKIHQDPFGNEVFGEWNSENLVYWFIRLVILTHPFDPIDNIRVNSDSINLSVAIVDEKSTVIGGAFNSVVEPGEVPFRNSDPFLDAVMVADKPIFDLIFAQEHDAVEALKQKYPGFRRAHESGKVGLHFMIARSPDLPKEDTFELVAASAEAFQNQGYQFMVVTASNQWTGAACEALNGTRVHFVPFRNIKRVPYQGIAISTATYSSDGYISAKDSGAMFYVIKLN